jgi:hypothetical protein
MKYLKMLGLAAVAAKALKAVAGAGTASATEICTVTSYPCPAGSAIKELQLSKDPNTTPVLETTEGSIQDTCTEALAEGASTQGDSTHTVLISDMNLGFTGCTNTTTPNNKSICEVEFHGEGGSDNATATAQGCTIAVNLGGVTCRYGAGAGVTLGTFVGGTTRTIAVNTVLVGIDENSFLCSATLRWTTSYVVTNHTAVYFHK